MALDDAYQRAVDQGRFEGAEAEGGKEARARAQLRFEEELAGKEADQARSDFARRQQELLAKQRQEEEQAIGAFQQKIEGFERPTDIFSRLETERGVPDIRERTKAIRQRASDLERQLGALPDDVTQRLSGTLSTEAQRRRVLAKEQQPLLGGLQDTTRELGVESGNLAEAMQGVAQMTQLALQGQERLLEPDRMRIAAMSDRAARELAAFSQEREAELNALMDKLARTRQLADNEMQRAFELAQQETAYEQALGELREQARLTEQQNVTQREFTRGENALDRELNRELQQLRSSSGGGSAQARQLALMRQFGLSDEEIRESLFGLDNDEPSAREQYENLIYGELIGQQNQSVEPEQAPWWQFWK